MRGDAAQMDTPGAVLNEHQHAQPCQQHRVYVQEVDGQDSRGLGVQELPPCRAWGVAAPDRCRHAGFHRWSRARRWRRAWPARHGSAGSTIVGSPARGGRRSGRCPARSVAVRAGAGCSVSYFRAASLRCQASSVAGVIGKIPAHCCRGMNGASAANQARSAGSYRTRPTVRRSTAFSCRSTKSSASSAPSPRDSSISSPSNLRVST